ncbi:hypothetical protein AV530_018638 [Patagioenas fasciata monilis]|uniref:Uncharacterized protein n=1 Tax=Patagioenas fasciata monilis TaxID=372326 RepID=A0A1V4JGK8_PATFA|nr:hypothetical protein AV530_018638 [Patagioenas fasciata monilis]
MEKGRHSVKRTVSPAIFDKESSCCLWILKGVDDLLDLPGSFFKQPPALLCRNRSDWEQEYSTGNKFGVMLKGSNETSLKMVGEKASLP